MHQPRVFSHYAAAPLENGKSFTQSCTINKINNLTAKLFRYIPGFVPDPVSTDQNELCFLFFEHQPGNVQVVLKRPLSCHPQTCRIQDDEPAGSAPA